MKPLWYIPKPGLCKTCWMEGRLHSYYWRCKHITDKKQRVKCMDPYSFVGRTLFHENKKNCLWGNILSYIFCNKQNVEARWLHINVSCDTSVTLTNKRFVFLSVISSTIEQFYLNISLVWKKIYNANDLRIPLSPILKKWFFTLNTLTSYLILSA